MNGTQYVYLLGPTCVGKGYLMSLLRNTLTLPCQHANIGLHMISIGDIIKVRLQTDSLFADKYLGTVTKGHLIEDPEPIMIFRGALETLDLERCERNLVFVDGYCRTVPQIEFSSENGYLTATDIVLKLEASLKVCLERFLHRKNTIERIDAETATFHERYHLHTKGAPALERYLDNCDCQTIGISAEKDIPSNVFTQVLSHILINLLGETSRKRSCSTEPLGI